jgi:subtilisin family serine protease
LRIGPDTQMPNQSGLSMIHHARLGPKQVSRDGHVLRVGENDVHYLIDTAPGSAGAPVFDADWRVIASHRASTRVRQTPAGPRIRVKLGTSMAALLSRLRDRESHRMLWREVVAAQPALKSINVNLSEHLSQSGAIPVVLELLDSEPLGPVPGFSITAQTAEIVTGLCTGTGLKELTEHPKVLSIDLSHPVGGTECATSVPHIGAHLIHHAPGGELGDKAMIALIDSGIDVLHRAFCDGQGRTRIVAFWDQHDTRSPATDIATPAAAESRAGKAMVKKFGLKYGALYLASDINRFLTGTPLPATFPPIEAMAHGTVVGGVAAGRRTGATADHFAGGVAPSARLVVVRYDLQDASIGYSKGHIDALNFIDQIADAEGLPVVVNISNGMNAGAHDGTSLLERACDMFTGLGARSGRIIIKSAGNERGQGRHASITVPQSTVKYLRWRSRNYFGLAPSTSTEELEIWFNHLNQYQFRLRTPSGHWSPTINAQNSTLVEYLGNRNFASILLKPYHPDNGSGSLNIKISPGEQQGVEEEEWQLEITGVLVPQREPLHAWIEQIANRNVFFQDYLDDRYTVTIPGTANHVISVGAVAVSQLMTPYERSSWGPTRKGVEKPELVAPGVNLFGPGANLTDRRSQRPESGTSVAAPHLAGAIALALSLCVKSGRAPHTSMRVRSALQETARYGTRTWNEETGYGELDAEAMYRNLLGP